MTSIFSSSSPFDADVEKATSPKKTSDDWTLILEICDKVGDNTQNAKDCLKAITKRLFAQDPHIVVHALTLLDACSGNCGKVFHLEIASRSFEQTFKKLIATHRSNPKLYDSIKSMLRKWAEGDYKTDPQLNIIPSLYHTLRQEGHDFSVTLEAPKKSSSTYVDPTAVTSAQEEEELAKAIELSLKESTQHSTPAYAPIIKKTATTNLYPPVDSAMAPTSSVPERRQVLALYDFEAAEDNELSFKVGEIIDILDDSDPNWWKGSTRKGEGLFPSNFVTADLSVEPEQFTKLENKKSVQFAEEVEVKTITKEPEPVETEIDEMKIDKLLQFLSEADPSSNSVDPPEMLKLEEQVATMNPLIDSALEKVDKQHAQLTQLSSDAVDALNLYHMLMRSNVPTTFNAPKIPYSYPQQLPSQVATHDATQGPPTGNLPSSVLPQGLTPTLANSVYQVYNGMQCGAHPTYNPGVVPTSHYPVDMTNNKYPGTTANMASMTTIARNYPVSLNSRQQPAEIGQPTHVDQNNAQYSSL